MLASVPPFANPAWNAALFWAASCAWFPATAGERAPPAMLKPACSGGLLSNWSATVPGKESANNPKPPRTTVFLRPKGVQVKPKRGSPSEADETPLRDRDSQSHFDERGEN